jgi:hypothetical protein
MGKKNAHKLTVKEFRGARNNRSERNRVGRKVITIRTVVVYHPPGLSEASSFSGLSMSTEAG